MERIIQDWRGLLNNVKSSSSLSSDRKRLCDKEIRVISASVSVCMYVEEFALHTTIKFRGEDTSDIQVLINKCLRGGTTNNLTGCR